MLGQPRVPFDLLADHEPQTNWRADFIPLPPGRGTVKRTEVRASNMHQFMGSHGSRPILFRRLIPAGKQRRHFAHRLPGRQTAPLRRRHPVRDLRETKLLINPARGARQKRPQQNRQDAARLRERVEHFIQSRGLRRVFRQFERSGLIHILVGPLDKRPDTLQGGLQLVLL